MGIPKSKLFLVINSLFVFVHLEVRTEETLWEEEKSKRYGFSEMHCSRRKFG